MESKKRAMDESGVSSASQTTVASDLPTSRRHSATQAALGDTRNHNGHLLHQPDTGGAVNALEVELDGGEAIASASAVEFGERGIVELAVIPAPPLGRLLGSVDPVSEFVVSLETGAVDHVVGHPATRAAELKLGLGIDKTRRHRQPAVVARDIAAHAPAFQTSQPRRHEDTKGIIARIS